MDILIATGRLAQQTVREAAKENADVIVLDIDVAAFITPGLLMSALPDGRYDLILVPGLVSSDFTDLEERCKTQIRLGPRHAYDLTSVLSCVGELELSKTIPACEFLSTKMREDAVSHLIEHERGAMPALELCGKKVGGDSRMKVMAEIAGATAMPDETLTEKIREFEKKGADIIDLGATMDCSIDDVIRSVKIAKATTELPVSIDTLDPDLIVAGIKSGADLVLSLNSSNIDAAAGAVLEYGTAVVIIPDRGAPGSLFRNIEYAKSIGIEKIIADLVLDPVGHGVVESIYRYTDFRKQDKATPLFFGVGNVTELIDADSVGVNALLTGIASELGADILFTPEHSDKARGSIAELVTASQMMVLATERSSSPKDLGIDLLILKEKRYLPDAKVPEKSVLAKDMSKWDPDPAGCLRIEISRDSRLIIVTHAKATIIGTDVCKILTTAIEMGLLSRLDHAGYLGRELTKAKLALDLGWNYSQDEEFLKGQDI
ncbi:MAG: dihydropteroate synthase-like protein [Candidatus Methanogaster sp.]|uniref:Dihydropteroate synthase-like protein n=1 Tax=Candidatus Methanogaster sp. TaxID=3386292 RepID=A0AC61KY17_9EURY|nr:MAG: dihydropteroate synthase-like protein [ANME-2 cluster archaeon]